MDVYQRHSTNSHNLDIRKVEAAKHLMERSLTKKNMEESKDEIRPSNPIEVVFNPVDLYC